MALTLDQLQEYLSSQNNTPQSDLSFDQLVDKFKNYQSPTPADQSSNGSSVSTPSSMPTSMQPQAAMQASQPQAPILPQNSYGANASDQALLDAINNRNNTQLAANLSKAGSQIGAAIASKNTSSPIKADTSLAESVEKQAGQPITDILTQREAKDRELKRQKELLDLNDEASLRDPNSAVSKALRDGAKLAGLSLPDDVSGKQLRDSGINLGTLLNARQAAEARKEAAALRMQQADQGKSDRQEMQAMRLGTMINNKVQNDKNVQNYVAQQQRFKNDLNLLSSGQPITSQMLSELEQSVVTGVRGSGGGSLGSLQRTEMETAQRKLTNLAQQLSGKPGDLRKTNPEIVKYVQDTIQRLHDGFENKINDRRAEIAESYKPVAKGNKRLEEVLDQYGQKEDNSKEESPSKGSVSAGTLKKYAEEHGIDEDSAGKLLKQGGYDVEGY